MYNLGRDPLMTNVHVVPALVRAGHMRPEAMVTDTESVAAICPDPPHPTGAGRNSLEA
jgi:hypothetical protein